MQNGLRQITALLTTLSCMLPTYASVGECNFGKQTIESVNCDGPVVLRGTTVSGDIKVAGPLRASDANVQTMKIAGTVELSHTKVNGVVNINGNTEADNVEFQSDLNIVANSIFLNHSTVHGSMTINSPESAPKVLFQCGTTVLGSVKFTGKAGIIQVTDDSIVRGQVVNGTLEFVSKQCS